MRDTEDPLINKTIGKEQQGTNVMVYPLEIVEADK
jgi:hypothetical protein